MRWHNIFQGWTLLLSLCLLLSLLGSCQTDHKKGTHALNSQLEHLRTGDSLLTFQPDIALDYALSVLNDSLIPPHHQLRPKALFLKGRALIELKDFEAASESFKTMMAAKSILNEPLLQAKGYYYWGIAEAKLENYLSSIINFRKTINLGPKANDVELVGDAAEALGDIYAAMRYPKSALKYYRQAHVSKLESRDQEGAYRVNYKIGDIYAGEEKLLEASEAYQASLSYFKETQNKVQEAVILHKISKLQLLEGNAVDAIKAAESSRKLAFDVSDLTTLLGSYGVLARGKFALNDFENAIRFAEQCLELSDILNNENELLAMYSLLAKSHALLGHHKRALSYYEKHNDLADDLMAHQADQKSRNMLNAIRIDKAQKEIASLQKKNEIVEKYSSLRSEGLGDNRSFIILLTAFVVVFILLVAVYYQRFKEKKNVSSLLEKLVEERTAQLDQTLQKLFFHINNTSLAVIELNKEGKVTHWSGQSSEIFGREEEEVIDKDFLEIGLFEEDELEKIREIFGGIREGKLTKKFVLGKSHDKDHHVLFIEWNFSALRNDKGQIASIICFANNVTPREKALEHAETANRELDNFIYKTSHDVKGPIARIEGLINLGIMEAKEEVSKQYFTLLKQVAGDFNIVLSRLFRIHGIYYHEPVGTRLNLKQEIESLLQKLQKKNALYELKFQVDIPEAMRWTTDKLLFYIIVQNIYENALDYRRDGLSRIVFTAEVINSKYLKLLVRDNGTCIPFHAADRVFDMFFQNKAQSNTAGLGLYMVKKAVEKLGGRIQLREEQEETFFEILLPAH